MGSATWRKPRPRNVGSPKSGPRCPGEPCQSRPGAGHAGSRLQTKLPLETVFPEGSAISAAGIKYFYSKVFNFFLIWCIEGSTFLYFLKLQTKISHPGLPQGHTETISNHIYMPANSKYVPNDTEGPEPVSQQMSVPESRGGRRGPPRQGGEVGAPALSSRQDARLYSKPGEKPLQGREYAGERQRE